MSNIQIQNKNHSNFTITQNILSKIGLTAFERSLYFAIKECAGENGICTKSYSNLSIMSGMSEASVKRTLKSLSKENKLLKKPLISIEDRYTDYGDRDTKRLIINDLWTENFIFFKEKIGQVTQTPGVRSHRPQGSGHTDPRGQVTQTYNKDTLNKIPLEEDKEHIARSSTSSTPSRKDLLAFDFESKKFINIEKEDLENWKVMYPHVELGKEILKAQEWLISNPSKSRKKNWRKYLTGWFSRTNDHIENKKAFQSNNVNIDRRAKNTDGTTMNRNFKGRF